MPQRIIETHEPFLSDILGEIERIERDPVERAMRAMDIGTGRIALATRYFIRRNDSGNIYAHVWHNSDPDDLHDHPWDFISIVVKTGYWEITPEGRFWRAPGSIRMLKATDRHRVELPKRTAGNVVSLIITGPEIREWGFHKDGKFVVGREYRSIEQFRERRPDWQNDEKRRR